MDPFQRLPPEVIDVLETYLDVADMLMFRIALQTIPLHAQNSYVQRLIHDQERLGDIFEQEYVFPVDLDYSYTARIPKAIILASRPLVQRSLHAAILKNQYKQTQSLFYMYTDDYGTCWYRPAND